MATNPAKNPYGSPTNGLAAGLTTETGEVWRDGTLIVCRHDSPFAGAPIRITALPDRCVKCNADCEGRQVWTGSLRKGAVRVGICSKHFWQVRLLKYLGVVLIIAGFAGTKIVRFMEDPLRLFLILGLIAICGVGCFLWRLEGRVARIAKMYRGIVWIKGAGPKFLDSLPPAPWLPKRNG
jgi:hypothetical protein